MLSLAKCHVEPPKDCQISSSLKEFSVNQKLCLKPTNLNTGEEKIDVGNTDLLSSIAVEEVEHQCL